MIRQILSLILLFFTSEGQIYFQLPCNEHIFYIFQERTSYQPCLCSNNFVSFAEYPSPVNQSSILSPLSISSYGRFPLRVYFKSSGCLLIENYVVKKLSVIVFYVVGLQRLKDSPLLLLLLHLKHLTMFISFFDVLCFLSLSLKTCNNFF
jgi:hypothetical protein